MPMDKRQFVEDMIAKVRTLIISRIISARITLKKKSGSHLGLCPFHNDKTMGSFVATDSKHIFKCFACGVGGDGIKFISHYDGINYLESAFKVALEHGVITSSEYEEYWERKRYSKGQISKIEKIYTELDKEKLKSNIADEKDLNKVFSLFIDSVREHYAKDKENYVGLLSKAHYEHLKEERKLSDEEILKGNYFTFPDRKMKMRFIDKIKRQYNKQETILGSIPGFYKELDRGYFTFVAHKGIGILIKNARGLIIGIQIRHDFKDEGKSRYVWWSSAFANFDDKGKFSNGTSSGSPIDVVYPENLKTPFIFITEGRFKALKLTHEFGAVCISVQGVSTWRGVKDVIQEIVKTEHFASLLINSTIKNKGDGEFKYENAMICFDADMNYKTQVFEQARNLSHDLKENGFTSLRYALWDEENGKGIDDIINAGFSHTLVSIKCQDWNKEYDKMVINILDDEEVTCIIKETSEYQHNLKNGFEKIDKRYFKKVPEEKIKEYFKRDLNPVMNKAWQDMDALRKKNQNNV